MKSKNGGTAVAVPPRALADELVRYYNNSTNSGARYPSADSFIRAFENAAGVELEAADYQGLNGLNSNEPLIRGILRYKSTQNSSSQQSSMSSPNTGPLNPVNVNSAFGQQMTGPITTPIASPTTGTLATPLALPTELPEGTAQRLDELFERWTRRELHNKKTHVNTSADTMLLGLSSRLSDYLAKWPPQGCTQEQLALYQQELTSRYTGHEGYERLSQIMQDEQQVTRDRYRRGLTTIEDYELLNARFSRISPNGRWQQRSEEENQERANAILAQNASREADHRDHVVGLIDKYVPKHKFGAWVPVRIVTLGISSFFDNANQTERENNIRQLDDKLQPLLNVLVSDQAQLHRVCLAMSAETAKAVTDVPRLNNVAGLVEATSLDAILDKAVSTIGSSGKVITLVESVDRHCKDIDRNIAKYCQDCGISSPKKIQQIKNALHASAGAIFRDQAATDHVGGTPNYNKLEPIQQAMRASKKESQPQR